MIRFRLWASAAVVAGAALGVGAPTPSADAHHCADPGNMTATVGGVAVVGARFTPNGAYVCADPPNQGQTTEAYVSDDPGRAGAVVSGATCGGFACQGVPPVGAEISLPTTHADLPGDGNGWTGLTVGTAGGVCAWPAGAPTCVGGGMTQGGYTTPPRPVDPALDYGASFVSWYTQWPVWCVEFIPWAGIEGAAVLCAFGTLNGVLYTTQDLPTRVPGWL